MLLFVSVQRCKKAAVTEGVKIPVPALVVLHETIGMDVQQVFTGHEVFAEVGREEVEAVSICNDGGGNGGAFLILNSHRFVPVLT
ncbi:hypothetical protein D3C80_1596890 [compost metagenome]